MQLAYSNVLSSGVACNAHAYNALLLLHIHTYIHIIHFSSFSLSLSLAFFGFVFLMLLKNFFLFTFFETGFQRWRSIPARLQGKAGVSGAGVLLYKDQGCTWRCCMHRMRVR